MKPIGPETESGPAVVPTTEAELRFERNRLSWDLVEARGRIAQLEEALAAAHEDLEIERSATVDVAESMSEAQQRHAVEMGEMRSALLHLCRQLEREILRGGGA